MSGEANAHYYKSTDGLDLFFRDFGSQNDGTPVICLPGLTRNSRDFEDLANYLCNRRRVLTVDFRGRGCSDHDPVWQNYHPGTYVADVWALLDSLNIRKTIVVGTSLGGLCAMRMAAQQRERVAGIVMNDVGPEINPAGLERIQEYTGRMQPVTTWEEAAQQAKEIYGHCLADLTDADWDKLVRRGYRENAEGVPQPDMDANIGRAVREIGPQKGDPWALFDALRNTPTTVLWGVLSDILTDDIVEKMKAHKPDLNVVPIPNRGHVPLLNEPECLAALDDFLQQVP